jgi:SAM-dependent methyltransferase
MLLRAHRRAANLAGRNCARKGTPAVLRNGILPLNHKTREDYRRKRQSFLNGLLDVSASKGLELGACDLPTVPPNLGRCSFADVRSADALISMWNLVAEDVVPVRFLIDPRSRLDDQIGERFDYVIACHVLEHIPNPIGCIEELSRLLRPGGQIVLAIPDKRSTPDALRPSTTIEHLLGDHFDGCRYPAVEHIMEFAKYWVDEVKTMSTAAAYRWAQSNYRSGQADVHCHVWTDEEFFHQIEQLMEGDILNGLRIAARERTPEGYNEFTIALRAA